LAIHERAKVRGELDIEHIANRHGINAKRAADVNILQSCYNLGLLMQHVY